jgi:hypothetical protein
MKRLLLLALACAAAPVLGQETPRLGLEHAMQLRCSAAFGIIAGEQARGVASAKAYPPLGERGREFFVRAAAGMMNDLALTREQVQALLSAEVNKLQEDAMKAADPAAYVESVMQPCLLALDASGL